LRSDPVKKRLVIFGAGGFGREVLQLVRDINETAPVWECEGFLVDSKYAGDGAVQGLPILGDIAWLSQNPEALVVIAVGSPAGKRQIALRIRQGCENSFATLVHPRAWVGQHVDIGEGSILCAGALVTTDIRIGRHVHVNIGATIGHDAILEDFVTLNPSVNVSGKVKLEQGVEVGTSSVLIPGCVVGCWSIIGAGSVVTRSLPPNITAVGAPAKAVKERTPGWHESQDA
jgi:sugar O-acyltransferase (sialic acid O-acetyltransferase NeuD family)